MSITLKVIVKVLLAFAAIVPEFPPEIVFERFEDVAIESEIV